MFRPSLAIFRRNTQLFSGSYLHGIIFYGKLRSILCIDITFYVFKIYILISEFGVLAADQFVWVSGLPLGPLTRYYLVLLFPFDNYFILFPTAFSLTRKRVCSLQCLHSLVWPLMTNNHILLSHSRLCSLSVASYDSQGLRWKYSNPPPHGSILIS
jgi:hypothetical protein